jgi:mRNA-degrading endonuclease RelE of RelBE toxin-antitoxin system
VEPYGVRYSASAREALKKLKHKDPPLHRETLAAIAEAQAEPHDAGYALKREWDGCRAKHFGSDKRRLIWAPDDRTECVGVLMVGERRAQSTPIYSEPRPQL